MNAVGLDLIVRSETEQLSSKLRDKITALESKYQRYHLRRGELPFETFSLQAGEYTIGYAGVPLIARWKIKKYVRENIQEVVRIEVREDTLLGPCLD